MAADWSRVAARYRVDCDLGLQHFDDPDAGHRAARAAVAQLRRLCRSDPGMRVSRLRRRSGRVVSFSVRLPAASSVHAYECCRELLRRAVQAAGGTTAAWEHLTPMVRPAEPARSARPPQRRRAATSSWAPRPCDDVVAGWASVSATARRRGQPASPLPELEGSAPPVLDEGRDVLIVLP